MIVFEDRIFENCFRILKMRRKLTVIDKKKFQSVFEGAGNHTWEMKQIKNGERMPVASSLKLDLTFRKRNNNIKTIETSKRGQKSQRLHK